jgi:hypothetical protein
VKGNQDEQRYIICVYPWVCAVQDFHKTGISLLFPATAEYSVCLKFFSKLTELSEILDTIDEIKYS